MSMTSTQAVMGSPLYMSPEQMRSSKDVDARSDIWALGTVLYEALAGVPPFDGETVTALIIKITQDPVPPLRPRRLDIPPQLEAALATALEKDRARRYQTMAGFAAALAPFGSSNASASADRIARVLGAPRPPQRSSADLAAFGQSSPAILGAQTQGAHAVTGARTSSSGGRTPLIAGALAAVAVAVGIAAVALVKRSPAEPSAAAVAAPSVAALPAVPPVQAPVAPGAQALPAPGVVAPGAAAPAAPAVELAPPAAATVVAPEGTSSTASGHAAPPSKHAPTNGASPAHTAPASPAPAGPKPTPQSKDVFDDRKG